MGQFGTPSIKTLEYLLPVTTLTHHKCWQIIQPALEGGLPASGICKNMNRAIVHIPLHFQVLGIPSLYISQGIVHIEALLNAQPLEGTMGSLLMCSAENLKMEIRLLGHFLQQYYKWLEKATTQCWWTSTWGFVHTDWIQIEDSLPDLPLRRMNDKHLMEIFTRGGATSKLLRRLNQCRQATMLTDITTRDGQQITEEAWKGDLDPRRPMYYQWLNQKRLGEQVWGEWRKILKTVLGCHRQQYLQTPLHWCLDAVMSSWK